MLAVNCGLNNYLNASGTEGFKQYLWNHSFVFILSRVQEPNQSGICGIIPLPPLWGGSRNHPMLSGYFASAFGIGMRLPV